MYQSVEIIGNLGTEPELRFTQGGTAVCNFSVATNEVWFTKDGEKKERVEWFRVVVWGKPAETCEKYLQKGRPVHVHGRIQTREWEDKQGTKRYTSELVAQKVNFLGGSDGGTGEKKARGPKGPTRPPEPEFDEAFNDDDIPF